MLIGINDKLCETASSKRLDYLTGLEIIHRETKGGLERALGFVHVSLVSPWLSCRDVVNHRNLSMWRTASSSAVSCLKFWRCGWRHSHMGHMVCSSELCVKNPASSLTTDLAFLTKTLTSHEKGNVFLCAFDHNYSNNTFYYIIYFHIIIHSGFGHYTVTYLFLQGPALFIECSKWTCSSPFKKNHFKCKHTDRFFSFLIPHSL